MPYSKYYLAKKLVSYDNGSTWSDVEPLETQISGEPIATYDTYSECVGKFMGKFMGKYSDNSVKTVSCSTDTTLTITDTHKDGSDSGFNPNLNLTDCIVGDCVTSLGNSTSSYAPFDGCKKLKYVDVPSTITYIGENAFRYCSGLTAIVIPESVVEIGEQAFRGCSSLSSVVIPSGVTLIKNSTFESCSSMSSVTIPNTVTNIGNGAFYACSGLTSVTIPSSVRGFGDNAFYGCGSLTSITIEGNRVPTVGDGAFVATNDCPIYVPSNMVSSYKSTVAWDTYKHRIQAIP